MADRHLAREEEVRQVAKVVRWLDDLVRVPGTRFGIGLDPLLGLVPVVGDAISGFVSLSVLAVARRRGVPSVVLARMLLNVGIDTLVGMVPVVGDVFDVVWRANIRNLALLERHEGELEPRARAGDYAMVAAAAGMVALSVAAPLFLLVWLVGLIAG